MVSITDGCPYTQDVCSTSSLSAQAPKFGMLIPNRVFVGGITSNTTDSELKQFFSTYGPVKDCKIILDRAGVSKGYGFVTFEQVEDAEKLIAREGEHVLFKDRKLNINRAIRKQPALPRMYESVVGGIPSGIAANPVLYTAGGIPYSFQNGLSMLQHNPSVANAPGIQEAYTLAAVPQLALPSAHGYTPVMVPQQSAHLSHAAAAAALQQQSTGAYYQPQMIPGAPGSLQWAIPATQQQWPVFQSQGLSMAFGGSGAANPWVIAATGAAPGSVQLAANGQYYSSLPSDALLHAAGTQQHELMYAPTASSQYQTVDINDPHLMQSRTNEGNILLESGGGGGAGAPVQYVDVQYATAPPTPTASMSQEVIGSAGTASYASASAVQRAAAVHAAASQSYGVKRVLAVPRQVICTSSTSYGAVYGGAGGAMVPPPVKIVAGLGGQRMITKTVNQNEIQIVPKTQN